MDAAHNLVIAVIAIPGRGGSSGAPLDATATWLYEMRDGRVFIVDVPVAIAAPGDVSAMSIEVDGTIFPPNPPTTYVDLEGVSFRRGG